MGMRNKVIISVVVGILVTLINLYIPAGFGAALGCGAFDYGFPMIYLYTSTCNPNKVLTSSVSWTGAALDIIIWAIVAFLVIEFLAGSKTKGDLRNRNFLAIAFAYAIVLCVAYYALQVCLCGGIYESSFILSIVLTLVFAAVAILLTYHLLKKERKLATWLSIVLIVLVLIIAIYSFSHGVCNCPAIPGS